MDGDTRDTELLADEAVARVGRWLEAGDTSVPRRHRSAARRLAGVVRDRPGTAFAMRLVDRVIRPEEPRAEARSGTPPRRADPGLGRRSRVLRTAPRGGAQGLGRQMTRPVAGASLSGDLAQPLADGVITEASITADLRSLASGHHPGRTTSEEITLFKSAGFAAADLAAARLALN